MKKRMDEDGISVFEIEDLDADRPRGFAECREATWILIEEAWKRMEHGTLSDAAKGALNNMWRPLYFLREVEDGEYTDPGEIYYWGVKLGVAGECLRICLKSTALDEGIKGLRGREESIKTRAEKKRVVDDFILRWFDKKAAQHIGDGKERNVCRYAAMELNAAYQAGDREARGVLMQLNKDVFTPEMVRQRVQARKKQNG
jgi:hypothetical protein